MDTHVMAQQTTTSLVWDIRYCDSCKDPVDMNFSIKERPKRIKSSILRHVKYFTVTDYRDAEPEPCHYCRKCMETKFKELLNENNDLNHEISSSSGIVVEDEIQEMKAEEARRKEELEAKRELEARKTVEQSVREENEMLQHVFGHDGESDLQ